MSSLDISSRIGLGLAALGRPGYINLGHSSDLDGNYDPAAMQQRAHRVLDAALANRVMYFDTARSYGRAEEFLGNWLRSRAVNPADIAVGSKWGYKYTADWQVDAEVHEQKEHSLARLEEQWIQSKAHLGEHLDLYQIHSATLDTGVMENVGVLKKLSALKSDGIAIGLSTSGESQGDVILKAIETEVDGIRLFDAVQSTWNILETSAGGALQEAHSEGLKVIIKEALANGRLTSRNRKDAFIRTGGVMSEMASERNIGLDALALAFVLAHPWVTVVLSGASRVNHLQSNLMAERIRLTEEEVGKLKGLAEKADDYWAKRGSLDWN